MSTITFDFRHYYQRGERREAEQEAYQWDLGHVAEIYVPVNAAYEIHYAFSDFAETDDYAVESITVADDGGYVCIAHIPNVFFERAGELKVFVVGSADNHIITTYEGFITIRGRIKPEDYTDDDPENGAESIIARARRYAKESEAWAVGEIDGEPVPSTEPQYENNAEYYADLAGGSATAAAGSASDASDSATAAGGSASAADDSAGQAEAWAVGQIDGVDVPASAPQYENNAKYWAEQSVIDYSAILGDLAPTEASTTASKAYKVGQLLILGNLLYRVTTAIASGGTITPGTNVVQTTVADEVENTKLWFKGVTVSAITGSIIDLQDSRITPDHVLAEIVWEDSSKITSLTNWSTETAGHFIMTGTASAATTANVLLEKAEITDFTSNS